VAGIPCHRASPAIKFGQRRAAWAGGVGRPVLVVGGEPAERGHRAARTWGRLPAGHRGCYCRGWHSRRRYRHGRHCACCQRTCPSRPAPSGVRTRDEPGAPVRRGSVGSGDPARAFGQGVFGTRVLGSGRSRGWRGFVQRLGRRRRVPRVCSRRDPLHRVDPGCRRCGSGCSFWRGHGARRVARREPGRSPLRSPARWPDLSWPTGRGAARGLGQRRRRPR
jgi:hypothetical protein